MPWAQLQSRSVAKRVASLDLCLRWTPGVCPRRCPVPSRSFAASSPHASHLTVVDWAAIQAVFETLTVRRKGLYLQSGRTCDRVAFLAHGCLAASSTHAQADVTTHIFLGGSFVADYYSYLTCTPSLQDICAG